MLLHTDFEAGLMVMVRGEKPAINTRKPTQAMPDLICMGKCVQVDADVRYWWVAVDQGAGRLNLRKIAVLDILGVPAKGLTAAGFQVVEA